MKGWKSGFLLIDRRAIPDYMSWRHPSSVIIDPKPTASSYSQGDVQRLSASVVKLRDILEGVLILFGLSRVWKIRTRDPILKYLGGNVMGIHDFLCLPEWTGSEEDLAAATPSTKFLAKAEASKKQRASTSRAASSQVAKRTRSAMAHSSRSFARPNLFDDNDSDGEESDDVDDACVDIPLITHIRSAAMIPIGGNQIRGSIPSTVECPSTCASRRKVIMDDALDIPSGSAGRSQAFIGPTPASQDPTDDAIDRDFFPFAPGLYYATYPKDCVVIDSYEFSSPRKMVKIEALTNDRLARKMSVLHCLMMSNGRELLARYKGLESQVSSLKKQVTDLNDKITASDAAFVKAKAKGKERKKKIKSLFKSLD
ncbi:hypothetical protein Tco_0786086 [Tanacetum coccineum]